MGLGETAVSPSGYVKIAIENDRVEIVDFPMKTGGSFNSYVKLPEGTIYPLKS